MATLKLSFKCEKCGHCFVLGENAWLVTSSSVMGMFPSASVLGGGGSLEGSRNDPDLVDEFHGNYQSIDSAKRERQENEIQKVRSQLAKGKERWFKCKKCSTVQAYKSEEKLSSPLGCSVAILCLAVAVLIGSVAHRLLV